MKNKPVTVGELIDFLLEKSFHRDDIVVVETISGKQHEVKDIGFQEVVSKPESGTKLIVSLR